LRYFEKLAKEEKDGFFGKYILPSMIAGPMIGTAVHAFTKGKGKPIFSKDLAKSVAIAIPADILTGAAIGAWAER
jgi:hypothetical protein